MKTSDGMKQLIRRIKTRSHMQTTERITTSITGKRIIMLECECKEKFYTREDLSFHIAVNCKKFSSYIIQSS